MMADPAVQPVAQTEVLQFGDRARGKPVTAGLVPGELARVDNQHLATAAGRPGRGRGTGRAGADHDDFGPDLR